MVQIVMANDWPDYAENLQKQIDLRMKQLGVDNLNDSIDDFRENPKNTIVMKDFKKSESFQPSTNRNLFPSQI